jgi:hypothetical protein
MRSPGRSIRASSTLHYALVRAGIMIRITVSRIPAMVCQPEFRHGRASRFGRGEGHRVAERNALKMPSAIEKNERDRTRARVRLGNLYFARAPG